MNTKSLRTQYFRLRGSTLIVKYDLTAFQIGIFTKRKAVSTAARITRLPAKDGLSENSVSDATCLYSVYFNRLKEVCQSFSAENDLFLIIFF